MSLIFFTILHSHQGWLSEDQSHFVFGDETDERSFSLNTKTLVMNVISLTNPFLAGAHFANTAAVDHNCEYSTYDYVCSVYY